MFCSIVSTTLVSRNAIVAPAALAGTNGIALADVEVQRGRGKGVGRRNSVLDAIGDADDLCCGVRTPRSAPSWVMATTPCTPRGETSRRASLSFRGDNQYHICMLLLH